MTLWTNVRSRTGSPRRESLCPSIKSNSVQLAIVYRIGGLLLNGKNRNRNNLNDENI
jgi:hypothetical protein